MKSRPIIFSGPMVRAILEGRKTQTRRVVKPQPKVVHAIYNDASIQTNCIFRSGDQRIHCPYGTVGDRLWVKETFYANEGNAVSYRASTQMPESARKLGCKWKPSIFMPRWASRITLEITSVKVERLQDICDEDAESEGALVGFEDHPEPPSAGAQFRRIWDSINNKTHPWQSNPWVWVIDFKRTSL